MSFRGKSILKVTKATMCDFLTRELSRLLPSDQVVVTDVAEVEDGFSIIFYPTKEVLVEKEAEKENKRKD